MAQGQRSIEAIYIGEQTFNPTADRLRLSTQLGVGHSAAVDKAQRVVTLRPFDKTGRGR